MAQRTKRSISLPPAVAEAVEATAAAEGTTVSAWLAGMASRQLKLAAAQRDVAAWAAEIGLTAAELAEGRDRARRSLGAGSKLEAGLQSIVEWEAEHGPLSPEQLESALAQARAASGPPAANKQQVRQRAAAEANALRQAKVKDAPTGSFVARNVRGKAAPSASPRRLS